MNSAEKNHKTPEKTIEDFLEQPNAKVAIGKINQLLQTDVGVDKISDVLYELLTKREWFSSLPEGGLSDVSEKLTEHRAWYQQALTAVEQKLTEESFKLSSNPAWFSVRVSDRSPEQKSGHYKVYKTIKSEEYASFIQVFPDLARRLQSVGQNTGERISLKTPGGLLGFLSHNDSIVVHCDNDKTRDEILAIIDDWQSTHNLTATARELHRTEKAQDTDTESFSELVSRQVGKWALSYKNTHDKTLLAEEAVKQAILLSQKTPEFK